MIGNLHIQVLDPCGRVVDDRPGSNVFTQLGKTWLRDLSYWTNINSVADVPATNVRLRASIAGTGAFPPFQNVRALQTPVTYDGSNYLKDLPVPSYSPVTTVRYAITYPGTELATLSLTEFGLVVDDGTLDSTSASQTVVAYRSLETPVTKVAGQTLNLNWEIRF